MWIFTTFGMFSVVEDRNDRSPVPADRLLLVRSRFSGDLEQLKSRCPQMSEIWEDPTADYRYRSRVMKKYFAAAIADSVLHDVDYPNFKSAVASLQGVDREHLYTKVWRLLAQSANTKFEPDEVELTDCYIPAPSKTAKLMRRKR